MSIVLSACGSHAPEQVKMSATVATQLSITPAPVADPKLEALLAENDGAEKDFEIKQRSLLPSSLLSYLAPRVPSRSPSSRIASYTASRDNHRR